MSRIRLGLRLPYERALIAGRKSKERKTMKYILLMSASKGGVNGYHAWSQKEHETHMATLRNITKELTESGDLAPRKA